MAYELEPELEWLEEAQQEFKAGDPIVDTVILLLIRSSGHPWQVFSYPDVELADRAIERHGKFHFEMEGPFFVDYTSESDLNEQVRQLLVEYS